MRLVSELYIYPIKSLGGVPVATAEVTSRGFRYDRRWMLVDEHYQFLTQRKFPQMALIKVQIEDGGLLLTHPTNGTIRMPFKSSADEREVTVWDDTCTGLLVNRELDDWFSDIFQISVKLVYMPESTRRQVDQRYAPNGIITSFADAYPFLMIGQSSLDDLNKRLESPLSMDRFRPNIVFTGGKPFEEDLMKHIRFSDMDFYGVKLCARCVVTTIDQQTAQRGKEPLKTLSSYRSKNNKILFGQNLIHAKTGLIRVGDTIEVLDSHTEERFIVS